MGKMTKLIMFVLLMVCAFLGACLVVKSKK